MKNLKKQCGEQSKMKQFEKWNHIHYINDLRINDKITAKHKKQERNKGWKAALEWVLSWERKTSHIDIIKEELEDE